ncbi:MAG: kelch repeat-containing protein [Thermoplasmata archaeon]|nr:kelch repeat-containing protein [Thermoplasmata archaeon]
MVAVLLTSLGMMLGSGMIASAHPTPMAGTPSVAATGWTQLSPTSSPLGLASGGAMAYDSADGYLVLFGGCSSGDFWFSTCTPSNETWIYQHNHWSQLVTNLTPPARFYASLVWDESEGYLLLFGGNGSATTGFLNDTWTFVHGNWTHLSPSTSPPARAAAGLVYDGYDHYVLLVDGEQYRSLVVPATNTYVGADFNDSWKFAGGTWTQLSTADNPSARDSVSITYDASLRSVVLFGGFNWTTYNLDDTWLYQSGVWTLQTSLNGTSYGPIPGDRNNGALAYDPALGGDVLFGGHTGYQYYSDTWLFANGSWGALNVSGPSARWGTSLAWDPAVGCLVAYGGYVPMTYSNDTWSYGCSNSSGGNGSNGNGSSGGGGSNGNGTNNSSGNGLGGGGLAGHRSFGPGPASPGAWVVMPTVGNAIFLGGFGLSVGVGGFAILSSRRGKMP